MFSAGGVASDGGGSIRMPAHFCGIAGLKPTPGRIPGTGHMPSLGYPAGLVTAVGPMARTAEDLRLLFSVLAGYDGQDPFSVPVPLREPRSRTRCGSACGSSSTGCRWTRRSARRCGSAAALASDLGLHGGGVRAARPGARAEPLELLLQPVAGQGKDLTAEAALLNLAARAAMRAALLRQMEDVPAILMPVFGIAAFRHGESRWQVEGKEIGLFQAAMPAVVANVLGSAGGHHSDGNFERGSAHRRPIDGPALRGRTAAGNRHPAGAGARPVGRDHRIVLMLPKLCLLLGCAALACGAQPQKVFPYDYSQEDLPNGLRLITVPTDYANIVAVYIVVQTGSRNEVEPGHTGFAHLFEHLMFRGTAEVSAGEVQPDPEPHRRVIERFHAATISRSTTRHFPRKIWRPCWPWRPTASST